MCFKCGGVWHPGQCQYEGSCWNRLWSWLRADVKGCPDCGIKIMKNAGCNHMTCNKCKCDWCWKCGNKF